MGVFEPYVISLGGFQHSPYLRPRPLFRRRSLTTDFTQIMAPSNSRHPSFPQDFMHLGVWQIWTGSLSAPSSTSSSGLLGSPSASARRLSNQTSTATETQPIRQGSAAWTALKKTQSAEVGSTTPAYMGSSGYRPRTQSGASTRRSGQMAGALSAAPNPSPDWLTAAASINQLRTELQAPGAPGQHALPNGDRSALRRLVLGIVGENHDIGAMFEINR